VAFLYIYRRFFIEISLYLHYNETMTRLAEYLENADLKDSHFVGTITFSSEEKTLPDGSKIALGIDGGHWVLVYQKEAGGHFQVFEYDQKKKKVFIDKKPGKQEELKLFKKLAGYFFSNAHIEDLVTILPPRP